MAKVISRLFKEAVTETKAFFGGDVKRAFSGEHAAAALTGKEIDGEPSPMPEPPSVDASAELAKAAKVAETQMRARKRAIERNETIFTDPLGIGGTAKTVRKTLTGQ